MEKKPVNFVVKNAADAAKELNKIVEEGGAIFDLGVNPEYVTTVTKNSNGTSSSSKEQVYRIIGFADMCVGEELNSLALVREELKNVKKQREEMNRTLNVMNKSAFAPISIFLLIVAIITLGLGILTLANVLPLPAGQTPIAIVLTIVGVLALAGSILLAIFRGKKKKELLSRKDEILKEEDNLKAKEKDLDSRTPRWYKDALWTASGDTVRNAKVELTLKKK